MMTFSQSSPSRLVRIAVLAAAALYAVFFSAYTCLEHMRLKTWAYDLGTFDQGIWLAGHSGDYFVTVRGLHLLGDHVRVISFVLAPLYWIWDDVRALLVLQSVTIAAGVWFLLRICERVLPGRPFLTLAICASYLLHPAVQNLNVDHAHPDAFAMTLIFASIHFLMSSRLVAFSIVAALAMSCKEDVPLVFVAMGTALMLDPRRRKLGAVLAGISAAYFAACIWVILPHFNGVGFYRLHGGAFFAGLGKEGHDPLWILDRIFSLDRVWYLFQLGVPNLFLFLLSPLTMIPALPALAANLLSDAPYPRMLDFHYQTSILPFLYLSTAMAAARIARPSTSGNEISRRPRVPQALLAASLLAAVLASTHYWSRVPTRHPTFVINNWRNFQRNGDFVKIYQMLSAVPETAVVAADYTLVPHLTHRRKIYMLPNPFRSDNWGIHNENPHDPDDVEYIAIRNLPGRKQIDAVEGFVRANRFTLVDSANEFALYKVSRVLLSDKATCGDWDGDGAIGEEDFRAIATAIMQHGDCPFHVCDADGDGILRYIDVLRFGKRMKDPGSATLECPPRPAP